VVPPALAVVPLPPLVAVLVTFPVPPEMSLITMLAPPVTPHLRPGAPLAAVVPPEMVMVVTPYTVAAVVPVLVMVAVPVVVAVHGGGLGFGRWGGDDRGEDEGGELKDGSDLHDVR